MHLHLILLSHHLQQQRLIWDLHWSGDERESNLSRVIVWNKELIAMFPRRFDLVKCLESQFTKFSLEFQDSVNCRII